MIRTILVATLAVVAAVLAVQTRAWLTARDPASAARHRESCLFGALIIVSVSLGVPEVYWFVDGFVRLPALPQLIQHIATILVANRLQRGLAQTVLTPARARNWAVPRRLTLAATLLALVWLYAIGPLADGLPDISVSHAPASYVLEYQLVLCGYVVGTAVGLWWLGIRYRSHAVGVLRTALRLTQIGGGLATLTIGHRMAHLAVTASGSRLPWQESGVDGVEVYLAGPAITLLVVGAVLPRVARPVATWWRHHLMYHRLGPLWRALHRADGTIALRPPGRWSAWLPPLRLRFALHRRVIEIRDALIGALRPHLDPDLLAEARADALRRGLSAPDATAEAEAACIAAALTALAAADPPLAGPPPTLHGTSDLDSDAEHLSRTSQAFQRLSRLVSPQRA